MFSRIENKLRYYVTKAIKIFGMIEKNDRVMVCLSGGKDSYTLLSILNKIRLQRQNNFEIHAYTLDQSQPGWNDFFMRQWLDNHHISYTIEKKDTYSVVKEKIPEGKTYCSLCSRLRRGNIYRFAEENDFNKIALGHHRDDLIETLLMSIFYNGQIRSMPPKLQSDNKKHIVIRPLVFCQQRDIIEYAQTEKFPIIPCNLCGSQENLKRNKMRQLIAELSKDNPKVPSNILHALSSVHLSHLMDQKLWDFRNLHFTDVNQSNVRQAIIEDISVEE